MTTSSPAPRASPWEWTQTALLIANLAWTTLCLGGYRAETQIVTAALTAALVAVHLLERAIAPSAVPALHPAGWWFLPFLGYVTASVLWITPVRWMGWFDWLRWVEMISVFWVGLNGIRSHRPQRAVFFTLVLLGIVGVVLACYQRFLRPDWIMLGRVFPGDLAGRSSGSFGIPNSFAGFLLLLLPATGALAFRRNATETQRVWWGWATLVLGFGLVLTISRGAWVALTLALVVTPLIAARGGWWRRTRIALMLLLVVAAVGGALIAKSPKFRARFQTMVMDSGEKTRPQIWRGAWLLFRDAPWLGNGAESFDILFERHRPEGFRDQPLWAHNEYLNTLSDYGVIGFVLFFGACAVVAVRTTRSTTGIAARRQDWLDSSTVLAALGAGLLAFALQAMLDFHLKIPALALACATVAALAVGRASVPPPESSVSPVTGAGRLASLLIAVGVVAVIAIVVLPKLRADAQRRQARNEIDRTALKPLTNEVRSRLMLARTLLPHATEIDPRNGQAWSDLSYVTAVWAQFAPTEAVALGQAAEHAAERALACSAVCSEFWIRRGVARDLQGRWEEAGKDFFQAIALAPADAYAWYYLADHLSRMKWAYHATDTALSQCLRLDPGNPSGLALRQRLAINLDVH